MCRVLVWRPEGKKPLERPRHRSSPPISLFARSELVNL
jgi:hypothetical protein